MGTSTKEGPDILGGVTVGLIIILLAIIFVTIPNIFAHIVNFFTDFAWSELFPQFWWWTPQNPANHIIVYNAIYLFFIGTLVINIVVLILRVIFKDSYRRQIETIGGIVMSAGVTWAAYNLTLSYNLTVFTGYLIVFIGVSVIISSLGQWLVRQYTH
ncbi:MAG: hypothetical protein ACFFD8_09975 [Candidatus Thorarchaeota archaeon]